MAKDKGAVNAASAKASGKGKKKSNSFTQFFKDLRSEVKKVVWPSMKQIWGNTKIVLTFLALAAAVIWCVDFLLSWVMNLVF